MTTHTPAQRANTRTPNDWHAIWLRSVRPHLTPADLAWFADVDRTPVLFSLTGTVARFIARIGAMIGGAR